MNEALRDWVTNVRTTHYCIGSAAGPHPYPELVATLQRVIGEEARAQLAARGRAPPDAVVACVGGGSNAIGMFRGFLSDASVAICTASRRRARHRDGQARGDARQADASACSTAAKSYVLCDDGGQIHEAHSISAGLDYPGVGPEHAHLKDTGRARVPVGDGRRGARRGRARRAHRGHPPRARDGARVRLRARHRGDRRRAEQGRPVVVALCALGPRRQGPRHVLGARSMSRIDDTMARARARRSARRSSPTSAWAIRATTSRSTYAVACANAGADILELGVPFSDPTADGPAIARASERAIRGGRRARARARGRSRDPRAHDTCRSSCSATTTRSSCAARRASRRTRTTPASTRSSSSISRSTRPRHCVHVCKRSRPLARAAARRPRARRPRRSHEGGGDGVLRRASSITFPSRA